MIIASRRARLVMPLVVGLVLRVSLASGAENVFETSGAENVIPAQPPAAPASSELIVYRMPGYVSSAASMSVEIDGKVLGVLSTTGRYIVVPVSIGSHKVSIGEQRDIPVKVAPSTKAYVKVDLGFLKEIFAQVDAAEGERDIRKLRRE